MKKTIKYIVLVLFITIFIAGCEVFISNTVIEKISDFEPTTTITEGQRYRLEIKNAYGNNSAYHPSVVNFGEKWNGYKYWMAYTPYPKGDDSKENPHIMVSNDLENWVEPEGFKNPLEPVPADYMRGKRYNSDTELVYNTDTEQLECWWRFVDNINNDVIIYRKTTKDGVNWSEKQVVLKEARNKYDYVSPALIYEDNKYKMWFVDSPYSVYYIESSDLITWSERQKIEVEYEDSRLRSWHLDVVHENGVYEMVMNAFLYGKNRRTMDLYYLNSTDNTNWSKAITMLKPTKGTKNWDNQGLYRASLMYDNNTCYLFYSAISSQDDVYEGVGLIKLSNKWREF